MTKLGTTIRNVSILLVSLCTFGLACISANAATLFTEDFSDSNLPSEFQYSAHGVNPTFDGSVATFAGGEAGTLNCYRSYLKTVDDDYHTVDFVAEVTVNMTGTAYNNVSFFGLGEGEPKNRLTSCDPREAPALFIRADPRPPGKSQAVKMWDNSSFIETVVDAAGQGTHRLQLTHDATAKTLTAAIHQDYVSGAFVATTTLKPVSHNPDPDFTGSGHIFFGSASSTTFDNFSVDVVVPEPSTAGLVFLALAGLATFGRHWRRLG